MTGALAAAPGASSVAAQGTQAPPAALDRRPHLCSAKTPIRAANRTSMQRQRAPLIDECVESARRRIDPERFPGYPKPCPPQ
jgi:hypothetical protein